MECPPPLKPPVVPFDATTLWHGTSIGNGLFARAFPTALAAEGFPIAAARDLYVIVVPLGIFRVFFSTVCWNVVQDSMLIFLLSGTECNPERNFSILSARVSISGDDFVLACGKRDLIFAVASIVGSERTIACILWEEPSGSQSMPTDPNELDSTSFRFILRRTFVRSVAPTVCFRVCRWGRS